MTVSIDALEVADPPAAWRDAGFTVDPEGICRVGAVRIELVGRGGGSGLVGWTLRSRAADALGDVDGVPTTWAAGMADDARTPAVHANGVTAIDHIVLLSPDLDRTVTALATAGVHPRRERDADLGGQPIRQIFFRFGETVVEVVGTPGAAGPGPSTLWGVTFVVEDIDRSADHFGDRTTPVKPAVQPGRRITTLRHHELGMSVRTALISARR
jgi:hypothetical protein